MNLMESGLSICSPFMDLTDFVHNNISSQWALQLTFEELSGFTRKSTIRLLLKNNLPLRTTALQYDCSVTTLFLTTTSLPDLRGSTSYTTNSFDDDLFTSFEGPSKQTKQAIMPSRKLDLPAKLWTPPFSLETFQPAEPKFATPGPSIDSESSEPYLIGGPAQPRPLQQPTKHYVRSVSRNRWRCCQSFHPVNAHPISDMPLCYLPCSDACYWSECGHERCHNCLKGDELEDVWTKEHEVRTGRMALYKQDEEVATRVFQDKPAGQNSARKALQDLQCQVM